MRPAGKENLGIETDSDSTSPRPRLIATDFFTLYRPSTCRLRVRLRHEGVEEAPPGVFKSVLADLGDEHERRHLTRFRNQIDLGHLPITERAERTRELVEEGERAIYQGAFRTETTLGGTEVEIVGVPDFLLPARSGYAIRDSKLARRIGGGRYPAVELQLTLYGWLYEQAFGAPPVAVQVHAGDGTIRDLPYEGGDEALEILGEILEIRLADERPHETVGWGKCSGCGFFDHCWPPAVEKGSVGLLPWVDRGFVRELERQGIETLDQLLERFNDESLAVFERPWRDGMAPVGDRAPRILAGARALAENRPIPLGEPQVPVHPNYVMFDLEGMPPQLDELEKIYLWGMQVFGEHEGEFVAATAGFGRFGDREGWEAFLLAADALFETHGDIPFVHWASYERARINLYLDRYGDRGGVGARVKGNLLDLLPITYESVALPLSSYSLKKVEELTGYERQLDEYGGEWSMARYIEATETEDVALRDSIMDEILAYNHEDLEATWAVMEWLRGLGQAGDE